MKKLLYIAMVATILITQNTFANATMAKQVLSQNTTNPFCPAGNNNPASDDQYEQFKKDQFEGTCPQGMGYVECLRKFWQEKK